MGRRGLFARIDRALGRVGHQRAKLLDLRLQRIDLILLAGDDGIELIDRPFLIQDLVLENLEALVDLFETFVLGHGRLVSSIDSFSTSRNRERSKHTGRVQKALEIAAENSPPTSKTDYSGIAMQSIALQDLAAVAEIIGATSIVTGLLFGWIQIRYYRMQQRDAIAQSLSQTFYNRDLAHAIAILQNVPDGISLVELRELGREYEQAAVTVSTSFETMGILVFKRIAPLDLVADLAGGIVTTMSRKLTRFQEDLRAEQAQPSWGEWFSWLAEQVARVKTGQAPAHIAHRNWRP